MLHGICTSFRARTLHTFFGSAQMRRPTQRSTDATTMMVAHLLSASRECWAGCAADANKGKRVATTNGIPNRHALKHKPFQDRAAEPPQTEATPNKGEQVAAKSELPHTRHKSVFSGRTFRWQFTKLVAGSGQTEGNTRRFRSHMANYPISFFWLFF